MEISLLELNEHISENVERLKNLSSSQKQQMSRVCIKSSANTNKW